MDPQDQEFRSAPDRPLTRREIRARERAQAEAQERRLAESAKASGQPKPSEQPKPSGQPKKAEPTKPSEQPPKAARPAKLAETGAAAPAAPSTPEAPAQDDARPLSRPRTGRTLADWPAPVPASASHLVVKGAPVYEAEERLAASFRPTAGPRENTPVQGATGAIPKAPTARPQAPTARPGNGTTPVEPATGGLSVLKRAQAARAASQASSSAADAVADLPIVDGVDGRHRDAAQRHQPSGTQTLAHPAVAAEAAAAAEPGLLTDILTAVPDAQDALHEPAVHESTVHETVFASAEEVKAPRRRSRQFKALLAMSITLAFIVVACFVGAAVLRPILGMDKVADYPGPGTGQVVVTVQPGSGARAVAQDLQQDGVIADVDTFLKAFASTGASLHPGDFTFKKQMKSSDAAQVLAGDSAKVMYFALSAGLRVNESLDIIAKSAGVDRKDLDKLNAQPGQFGLPAQAKNLEGYLAPGEYRFPVGTSAKDILTALVSGTVDELKKDGITDPGKQYEVLTVASIV
ncbi:endolytic transglycosylase MltG, partial [Sinomonas gamaensis]|uniref:endolytic transglycosylase MltG n=1 Tax=Sinomonas gamaensis TaxID=2565624 RepID=UPI0020166CB4